MTQISYFWDGITTGDCGPYTSQDFAQFILNLFQRTEGVLVGKGNELAATNPAGTTIRIASGAAIIKGVLYASDTNNDLSVTAPGYGYNYYIVKIQKDFIAQTVRVVLSDPSTVSYPTATKAEGSIWEIEIARVSISAASAIAITDTRTWAEAPTKVSETMIQDASVTHAKMDLGVVENSHILDAEISPAKLAAALKPHTAAGDIGVYDGSALQAFPVTGADKVVAGGASGGVEERQGMVLIERQVLVADAASVTFSSIPQTFTNLKLIINARGAYSADAVAARIRINDDAGNNYQYVISIMYDPDYVSVGSGDAQNYMYLWATTGATAPAAISAVVEIDFLDYSEDNWHKLAIRDSGYVRDTGDDDVIISVSQGLWEDLDAITKILIYLSAGDILAGSTFSLYGY